MDTMIVIYNLAKGQTQEGFEQWLREVDLPGYARMSSLRNPSYYRTGTLLGEDAPAPHRYVVTIDMAGPAAVEKEMAEPEWGAFIADFEVRTKDAVFVTAAKIAP